MSRCGGLHVSARTCLVGSSARGCKHGHWWRRWQRSYLLSNITSEDLQLEAWGRVGGTRERRRSSQSSLFQSQFNGLVSTYQLLENRNKTRCICDSSFMVRDFLFFIFCEVYRHGHSRCLSYVVITSMNCSDMIEGPHVKKNLS